jgi:hypothetical protein
VRPPGAPTRCAHHSADPADSVADPGILLRSQRRSVSINALSAAGCWRRLG